MPTPPPTTWTERSGPASTVFLEGEEGFKKRSDNFYEIQLRRGSLSLLVARKRSDLFFELAGASYPGSYILGTYSNNFAGNIER